MPARSLARFIILPRSRASAFRLSLSSSGGIVLKTPSIAMSFASAKLMFISANSCSILSNVRLDKSFSESVNGRHYRGYALKMLRRSSRPTVAALTCLPLSNAGGSSSYRSNHWQTAHTPRSRTLSVTLKSSSHLGSRTSAFPKSGRSDLQKSAVLRGCLRP